MNVRVQVYPGGQTPAKVVARIGVVRGSFDYVKTTVAMRARPVRVDMVFHRQDGVELYIGFKAHKHTFTGTLIGQITRLKTAPPSAACYQWEPVSNPSTTLRIIPENR